MTSTTTLEQNPLLAGLPLRRRPEPCTIVIFGASGDLTERKLMPALYSLAFRRLLPEHFAVVGVARSEENDDGFREEMRTAVERFARDPFRREVWDELAAGMHYLQLSAMDGKSGKKLAEMLTGLDEERGTQGNRLYYFAVPPGAFEPLVGMVAGMPSGGGWNRLIVEKPFGHDLASARELNELVTEHFTEREIFRIDHYLGKETVQNMLALRFANGIFEPIWNRQFIDHVQITVAESIGIEGRAAFYETAGAIRDIFQNHLLQLLAITAMEPPSDFTADSVRNEKVKVLRSLHTPGPKSVVRGQYGRGFVEGVEVPGYREEEGVAPDSQTETFVAAKLYVDNWRWADTPFYVRMGKRLPRRETTIAIQFKRAPHPPFEEVAVEGLRPNVLLIHVQPDEGLSLAIGAKMPGQGMTIRTVHMDFLYGSQFREGLPEAYERLILDAMLGDATLFTRSDEIEEQWALVDAIVAGVGSATAPRSRTTPPGPGARRRRTSSCTATGAPGAATDAEARRRGVVGRRCEHRADRVAARGLRAMEIEAGCSSQRTSVMTHIAWVPPEWLDAAERTLEGMAERHPSRTVILVPKPDEQGGIDADVAVRCFPVGERDVMRRGDRADACAGTVRSRRRRSCSRSRSPTCRCSSLARAAAVRSDAVGATRRRRRPRDRRLLGVERARATGTWRRRSSARPCPTSPGRERPTGG